MEAGELTVSLPTVVQTLYTLALLVFGVIGWFLKGMIARLEAANEANARNILLLEDKLRKERERGCGENQRQVEKLRDECSECQELRRKEYTHTVDVFGKFGARLSRIEGKLDIHNPHSGVCQ